MLVPLGDVAVTIESGRGATTIATVADTFCAGLPLSLTVSVNVEVPLAVGVPEIRPPVESVSPAGRLPDVTDQV